jgi:hypothetical protein
MSRTMVFVTYDQAEDEIYCMSRKGRGGGGVNQQTCSNCILTGSNGGSCDYGNAL